MNMRHLHRCLSFCLMASLLSSSFVGAQDKPKELDKPKEADKTEESARVLFDAGAKAYAAGLYADAVVAFREAFKLAPDRPTVLFSLAQAERRQYTVKPEPEMLEAAIAHFRRYLEVVTEGGRRGDVVVALGELEALRVGAEAPAKKQARVFITTETPGAIISVDGKKRDQIPVIEELPPGKHDVSFEAPGFFTETREIMAVEGTIFPLEINLKEKPSSLTIKAPKGAAITVDGRILGAAPLLTPVELASGLHHVVVSQRGHVSYDERISLERAQGTQVDIALSATAQRKISYALFGTSILALGLGTGMAFGARQNNLKAEGIYAKAGAGNIDAKTLDAYVDALDTRNTLIAGSVGSFLATFAIGSVAAATYWFDFSQPRSEGGSPVASFSATPVVGGGMFSVGMRF